MFGKVNRFKNYNYLRKHGIHKRKWKKVKNKEAEVKKGNIKVNRGVQDTLLKLHAAGFFNFLNDWRKLTEFLVF